MNTADRLSELAALDLDTLVHRVAALKRDLSLLAYRPFHPETVERREETAALGELRTEMDRRAALAWAKLEQEARALAA